MQKNNSQSSESVHSDKPSGAKDIFKNLKTRLTKNPRQPKKRLSDTEKEQLEYITRLYAEIDPDTPEGQLTEIEKGVVKLKIYFEQQLHCNKPKPVANKEKELLKISAPLKESVMTNDKLEKISQNPLVKPVVATESSLVRNEAFFASCEELHLLEPPVQRSKSMNDIYFKQDEGFSVCLKHYNTTEDLHENVILRPGNSRLRLNITEGTYRITKSPTIPENRPSTIDESRNSFTQNMLKDDFSYETNSFFYQKPVKYENITYENLEYLYGRIDRNRPEESLSKEDRFVLRLKRALDEMGRKNTLRKSKVGRRGISGPTKESVMKNSKLTDIINDPNVRPVKKDPETPKKSILGKIGFKAHKRNSGSENVVDAVNENVLNRPERNSADDFVFSEEKRDEDAISFDDTVCKIFGSNSSLYETVILQSPLQKTIAERNASVKPVFSGDSEKTNDISAPKTEEINKKLTNVPLIKIDSFDNRETERNGWKDADRLSRSLFNRNLDKSEVDLVLSYVNTDNYVIPSSPINEKEMIFIERAKKEFPESNEHIYETFEGLKKEEKGFKKPVPLPRSVGVKSVKEDEISENLCSHKPDEIEEGIDSDLRYSVETVSVKNDVDDKIFSFQLPKDLIPSFKEDVSVMESKSSPRVNDKATGSIPKVPQNRHSSENVATENPSQTSVSNLENPKDIPDDASSDGSRVLKKVPKFLNDSERRAETDALPDEPETEKRHFFKIVPKESTDRSYLDLFKSPEEKTYEQMSGVKDRNVSAPYVNIHFFGGSDLSENGSDDSLSKTEQQQSAEEVRKPAIVDYVPLDTSKSKNCETTGPSASYDSLERVATLQMFRPLSSAAVLDKSSQDHDKYLDKCELERKSTSTSFSSSDSRKKADTQRLSVQDVRKKFEQSSSGPVPLPGLDFKYYDTLKRVPKKKNFRDSRKEGKEQ